MGIFVFFLGLILGILFEVLRRFAEIGGSKRWAWVFVVLEIAGWGLMVFRAAVVVDELKAASA